MALVSRFPLDITDMFDVSVVIVSWNTKKLLLRCIETLFSSTRHRRLEVIVVDNGSSDGSAEAVSSKFADVIVIRNVTNLGFAKANNQGICASSGKYICLVNSDVEVLDGCIDAMCDYMDQHKDIGLLGPRVLNKDLTLQPSCGELPSLRNLLMQALMLDRLFPGLSFCRNRFMSNFDHNDLRRVQTLSGCFLMTSREAINKVGRLDERFFIYGEDVDWCKRFQDKGWGVVFYPQARVIHYGGASSAAAPARFSVELQRADLQYWHKHNSWWVEKLAALIGAAHYWVRICGWAAVYLLRRGDRQRAKYMLRNYSACLWYLVGFQTSR